MRAIVRDALTILLVIWVLLSATIVSVDAQTVELNGCSVLLTEDRAEWAEVADGTGSMMFDTPGGVLDLTESGYGVLASGTYVVRWSTGAQETIELACEEPPIPSQDPAEVEPCQWAEPDELVEGCEVTVQAEPRPDAQISTTGVVDLPHLPETSTAE